MKTSHIFWGALFISLGILILLTNFDWLTLNWDGILKLWPFVFILWGLSILAKGEIVKNIVTGVVAVLIALTIFSSFKSLTWAFGDGVFICNDDDEYVSGSNWDTNTYTIGYPASIQTANLNFDAGAGAFILRDTTDKLFSAVTTGLKNNYDLYSTNNDSEAKVRFKMKKTRIKLRNGKFQNNVEVKLNPEPVWDINFDVGAASADIDLSKFKIKEANFDMGAASMELRLGNPLEKTKVSIDAGASSLSIYIPEGAASEIKVDASLSSKNFVGFEKINSELYRTANFKDADNKLYITIDSGVSSIDVKRY